MGRRPDLTLIAFLEALRQEIRVERAILFGSRARDDHLLSSDYDLILVSKDFEGIPFVKRMSLTAKYWSAPVALEALCYTPTEFEKKKNQLGIVKVAVEEGVEFAA